MLVRFGRILSVVVQFHHNQQHSITMKEHTRERRPLLQWVRWWQWPHHPLDEQLWPWLQTWGFCLVSPICSLTLGHRIIQYSTVATENVSRFSHWHPGLSDATGSSSSVSSSSFSSSTDITAAACARRLPRRDLPRQAKPPLAKTTPHAAQEPLGSPITAQAWSNHGRKKLNLACYIPHLTSYTLYESSSSSSSSACYITQSFPMTLSEISLDSSAASQLKAPWPRELRHLAMGPLQLFLGGIQHRIVAESPFQPSWKIYSTSDWIIENPFLGGWKWKKNCNITKLWPGHVTMYVVSTRALHLQCVEKGNEFNVLSS